MPTPRGKVHRLLLESDCGSSLSRTRINTTAAPLPEVILSSGSASFFFLTKAAFRVTFWRLSSKKPQNQAWQQSEESQATEFSQYLNAKAL